MPCVHITNAKSLWNFEASKFYLPKYVLRKKTKVVQKCFKVEVSFELEHLVQGDQKVSYLLDIYGRIRRNFHTADLSRASTFLLCSDHGRGPGFESR